MTELEFRFMTKVAFSQPVIDHVFSLRCLPMEDDVQRVQSFGIQLEPSVGYELRRDGFDNWRACGACHVAHDSFAYASHGIVRVDLAKRKPEAPNPTLRYPTPLTQPDEAVRSLWQSLPLERLTPLAQAEILNAAAANALVYTVGVTGNGTTAAVALQQGKGVCQDYAHLLLALSRLSGFAARYCMGLIPGEGATHAWVELALPEGWVGFDPTHCRKAGEDYLRFAVGRDASDCRAENGVFRGYASQTMQLKMQLWERGSQPGPKGQ